MSRVLELERSDIEIPGLNEHFVVSDHFKKGDDSGVLINIIFPEALDQFSNIIKPRPACTLSRWIMPRHAPENEVRGHCLPTAMLIWLLCGICFCSSPAERKVSSLTGLNTKTSSSWGTGAYLSHGTGEDGGSAVLHFVLRVRPEGTTATTVGSFPATFHLDGNKPLQATPRPCRPSFSLPSHGG